MREDNIYSLIEKNKSKKTVPVDKKKILDYFYDKTFSYISLSAILAAIIAFMAGKYTELLNNVTNRANVNAPILLLLMIISFFMGIRLFQSIYLAKKDYTSVTSYLVDIIIFAAVAVFTSGLFPLLLFNHINYLYIAYAAISIIATINFMHLFSVRLKKHRKELDFFIERRIQFFNSIISLIISGLFVIISIMLLNENGNRLTVIILGSTVCLLIIINMMHSGQLTAMPKIGLHNEADSPKKIESHLQNVLGRILKQGSIDNIIETINQDIKNTFKSLTISRIGKKSDVKVIAENLVAEFNYVFEYIFNTKDKSKLERATLSLLNSAFGFGRFGYMNFYYIIEDCSEKNVGLVKIDSLHGCFIYKFLECILLPIVIIAQFGICKFPGICKRAIKLAKSQPSIETNEFELTYFLVFEQYRNKKYGFNAINLLISSLFHSKTNNIDCSKLTLLVRKYNVEAQALFSKTKFTVYTPEKIIEEPSEIVEAKGEGIFLQYFRR